MTKSIRPSRLILLSALFLIGLFVLDRGLYYGGNHLAASPYWHSEVSNRVTHAEKVEALIVGGCRAALHFDSQLIQNKIQLKTFNAGKAAIGIGNMEFILNAALTHQKPKYVFIVIDAGNLEENFDTARNDLIKTIPWFSKLPPLEKENFIQQYQLNNLVYKTGLFSFMGKGDEFIRAGLRSALSSIRKGNLSINDGYEPRDPKQSLEKTLMDKKEYEDLLKHVKKELSLSEFSMETYSRMISRVKKNGAEPILVVTPMHHLHATNEINAKVKQAILEMGKKESVQSFFYLDNYSSIANQNELWSDSGHLNKLGAEMFSQNFSNDLDEYIQKESK